jgi:hypothetical protein
MKAINQGNIFTIYSDSLKTYDQLPAQVYNVRFSKQSGFFLESSADLEIKESKVYGVHDTKCQKVLGTFRALNRNLGVILSGDKGIGKSLFAKLLASRAISEGHPVLVVDTYIPGIAAYIESVEQECVIMFDEFDKTFGDVKAEDGMASPQTELLSLFDGLASGKKLFVITCNELRKLNEFLINRPGRFHYHFRFEYPTPAEITEYMKDKLPEEYWEEINPVVSFSRKVKLNYDCLRAIAYELSTGVPFKEAIEDLNIINVDKERYTVVLHYENGMVAYAKNVYMDMFADDEVYAWLMDKKGVDYVRVKFNPQAAQWNEKALGNVVLPDAFSIDYYDYDDSEHDEKALVEAAKASAPAYIMIKREYDRSIHYAV